MDDLISRAEAIDAVHKEFDGCLVWDESGQRTADEVENILDGLPSAQPMRWIPVTERLPEVGHSVLLSVVGMYTAEGCLKDDGDWAQFRWYGTQKKDMVDAWMPLPEPWKGDADEINRR